MKKFIIVFGVLLVLLIVAALVIPSLIPAEVYKSKIEETLSTKLDREVRIDGDVGLSVFPTITAKAEQVSIANAEGFGDEPMVSMEQLDAGVKLLPLLSKRVEITKFNLVNAKVDLVKAADGRVNWAFGGQVEDAPAEPAPDKGPFRRDGRFSDLDISLGKIDLTDGAISYVDNQKQSQHKMTDVNMKLSLPAMDKPVKVDGSMVYNGNTVDVNLNLDTPKSFLQGQQTPIKLDMKSDLVSLSADGKFTESDQVTFDAKLSGDVPSVSKLETALNLKNPYAGLAETAQFSGNMSFDGKTLSGKGVDAKVTSDIINNEFNGDFIASKTPSASGDLKTNITNLDALLAALKMEIPQAKAVKTVDLTANLTSDGKTTSAKAVKLDIKGEQLVATYSGAATYGTKLDLAGKLSASSPSISGLIDDLGIEVPEQAAVLGQFMLDADVKGSPDQLQLSAVKFKTSGEQLNATYDGSINAGKTTALDGHAYVNSPSVPALLAALGMDYKQAAVLGDLDLRANISGATDNMIIKDVELLTQGQYITADYKGALSVGETQTLDGRFDVNIPSVPALTQAAGLEIANAQALGKFVAVGQINGPVDALALSGLKARAMDGMVNAGFEGNAKLGKAISYSGNLDANIASIRALAKLTGAELTPSSDVGAIYENFSVSGVATGTATKADFNNAKIKLDNISGAGDFSANFDGKPVINGNLALDGLDLRPYMAAIAAQNPTGKILPWREDPINFNILNMFDANLKATTPNIITDRMEMGQSTMDTKVRDGVMTANIPNMMLYGGQGNMDITLNAKSSVPKVAMDFSLNNVDGKSFLGAAAGYTKLTGNTGANMKITGEGRSQAAIMRSLDGGGNFELSEGVLSGIDVGKFVSNFSSSSLQSMVSNPTIPAGIGSSYNTPFEKLDGVVTIKDGVATIGNFDFTAGNVFAEGGGTLDIGNQKVDFSLRPRLKNGSGLAAYGIPLTFRGNFGSIKPGLDTRFLQKIIAAQAKQKITDTVKDQIGGAGGSVVNSVLDAATGSQSGSQSGSGTSTEEVLSGIASGILGGGQQQTEPANDNSQSESNGQEEEEESQTPEDQIEDALGSLFGKKKD